MKMMKCCLTLVAILSLVMVAGNAFGAGQYDFGASDTEIRIGNIMPYSSSRTVVSSPAFSSAVEPIVSSARLENTIVSSSASGCSWQ